MSPAMVDARTPAMRDRPIAALVLASSLIGVAALAVAPWRVALWLCPAALVTCPGLVLGRLAIGRFNLAAMVIGLGVGVAGLMLVGEAMVLAHLWAPAAAAYGILAASAGVSVAMLARPTGKREKKPSIS